MDATAVSDDDPENIMRSQGIVCTADDGELEKAIQEDLEHYRERKAEDMEQSTV